MTIRKIIGVLHKNKTRMAFVEWKSTTKSATTVDSAAADARKKKRSMQRCGKSCFRSRPYHQPFWCMYVCMSRICTLSLSIFLFVSTRTCVCVYQVYVQSKKNSRRYEAAWISSVKWILSIQRIVRITILVSHLISIPFNCALFLSYFYFFFF